MPKIRRETLIEELVQMGMAKSFTFVFEGQQQYWITYEGVYWSSMRDPFAENQHSYFDCLIHAHRSQAFREAKLVYYHG